MSHLVYITLTCLDIFLVTLFSPVSFDLSLQVVLSDLSVVVNWITMTRKSGGEHLRITYRNTGQLFRPNLVSSAVYTMICTSGYRTSDHRLQSRNSTTEPLLISHTSHGNCVANWSECVLQVTSVLFEEDMVTSVLFAEDTVTSNSIHNIIPQLKKEKCLLFYYWSFHRNTFLSVFPSLALSLVVTIFFTYSCPISYPGLVFLFGFWLVSRLHKLVRLVQWSQPLVYLVIIYFSFWSLPWLFSNLDSWGIVA